MRFKRSLDIYRYSFVVVIASLLIISYAKGDKGITLVGEWVGSYKADKISYIFYPNGIATVDGKVAFRYELDSSRDPAALDFVATDPSGKEVRRIKTIFRFLEEDKMKLAWSSEASRRPKQFEGDNVLAIVLTRVTRDPTDPDRHGKRESSATSIMEGKLGQKLNDGTVFVTTGRVFPQLSDRGISLGMNYEIGNLGSKELVFDKVAIEFQFISEGHFRTIAKTITIAGDGKYEVHFGQGGKFHSLTDKNLRSFIIRPYTGMRFDVHSGPRHLEIGQYRVSIAIWSGKKVIHGPFTVYVEGTRNVAGRLIFK